MAFVRCLLKYGYKCQWHWDKRKRRRIWLCKCTLYNLKSSFCCLIFFQCIHLLKLRLMLTNLTKTLMDQMKCNCYQWHVTLLSIDHWIVYKYQSIFSKYRSIFSKHKFHHKTQNNYSQNNYSLLHYHCSYNLNYKFNVQQESSNRFTAKQKKSQEKWLSNQWW